MKIPGFILLLILLNLTQCIFSQDNALKTNTIDQSDVKRQHLEAYHSQATKLGQMSQQMGAVMSMPDDPIERLLVINQLEQGAELAAMYQRCFDLYLAENDDPLNLKPAYLQLKANIQRLEQQRREDGWELHQGYYRRGVRALASKDTADASVAFERSLLAKPGFPLSSAALALIFLDQQKPARAMQIAMEYIKVQGNGQVLPFIPVLSSFVRELRALQSNEAHTLALEIADSLLFVYQEDPGSIQLLLDVRDDSRREMLQAYLNVSEKASKAGNRRLALHYREMAMAQAESWNLALNIAPTPIEVAQVINVDTDVLTKQPDLIPFSTSTMASAKSVDASAGKSNMDGNELLAMADKMAFLAWQGDTVAPIAYLARIDSVLSNNKESQALILARNKIATEIFNFQCRRLTGMVEAALHQSDQMKLIGEWREALYIFEHARLLWGEMEGCPDKLTTDLTIPTLLLHSAAYESRIESVKKLLLAGEYGAADQLLDESNRLHTRDIGEGRGPRLVLWNDLIHPISDTAYLLHRANTSLSSGHLQETLWCLEKLRSAGVHAIRTEETQKLLGNLLASSDLKSTTLTNPKSLLVKYIPLVSWYRPLIRAYHKRFRLG